MLLCANDSEEDLRNLIRSIWSSDVLQAQAYLGGFPGPSPTMTTILLQKPKNA